MDPVLFLCGFFFGAFITACAGIFIVFHTKRHGWTLDVAPREDAEPAGPVEDARVPDINRRLVILEEKLAPYLNKEE